jgi:hypothetical protein
VPAGSAGAEEKADRAVSHYLWAMLLARIYEVFPLICPFCHAQMRIIVTDVTHPIRRLRRFAQIKNKTCVSIVMSAATITPVAARGERGKSIQR